MAQSNTAQGQITEADQFADDQAGLFERWDTELQAAFDARDKWHKSGNKVVSRFLDRRGAGEEDWFRLNLFHSNIVTLRSMLFGKLPEIDITRSNDDYDDDVARVASVMLQRMLQNDIGKPNDQYAETIRMNLDDRLIPGLGVARVRYEFDEETTSHAAQLTMEGKTQVEAYDETCVSNERAPIEYIHWRDFAWSPCRTWSQVRWVAFSAHLTRDQLIKRFGEKVGKQIPLVKSPQAKDETMWVEKDDPQQDAWARAQIWEIWNKSDKKIYWWCKEHPTILDVKDDPLKLRGFWPIPKPMAANITTTAYMPIPDFIMAQDLYNEMDKLETRISLITEAVKVVGVYDKSAEGIKRLMIEGVENDLIPVDNWAMWAEKGGMKGMIDWLPIAEIAGVLAELTARRNDVKQLLYEITGMSDIMRGAQAQAGGAVSATERALEARFASVRIQALQDEFANYATDLIRLRAEVISLHFSAESIIKQSNIERTHDAQFEEQAVQLLQDECDLIWRVTVKPESIAMIDYAALKQERTEYINALAIFMQSAAPLVEMDESITPFLLTMLQWGLAGFKGSDEVEGVLDQAIQQAQRSQEEGAGEEGPSPEEIKAQAEQQKLQMQMQADQQKVEGQLMLEDKKHQNKMTEIAAEGANREKELQMETQQDMLKEKSQMEANMQEESHETKEFIIREEARAALKPAPASA